MIDSYTHNLKTMDNIITVNYKIKILYDNMDTNNIDKYKLQLKKEINKENKLLKSLPLTEENAENNCIIYNNLLEKRTIDLPQIDIKDEQMKKAVENYLINYKINEEISNEEILRRFKSYIKLKFRQKPKKANNKNSDFNKELNQNTIRHQAHLDYYATILKFLDEHQAQTTDKKEVYSTISTKNNILFQDKEIEERYQRSKYVYRPGYEKCKKIGLDEDFVNKEYYEEIGNKINTNTKRCVSYENDEFYDKNKVIKFNIFLEMFKAGLYLFDIDQLKEIKMNYDSEYIDSKKTSVKYIINSIQEVIDRKEIEANALTPGKEKGLILRKKHMA